MATVRPGTPAWSGKLTVMNDDARRQVNWVPTRLDDVIVQVMTSRTRCRYVRNALVQTRVRPENITTSTCHRITSNRNIDEIIIKMRESFSYFTTRHTLKNILLHIPRMCLISMLTTCFFYDIRSSEWSNSYAINWCQILNIEYYVRNRTYTEHRLINMLCTSWRTKDYQLRIKNSSCITANHNWRITRINKTR